MEMDKSIYEMSTEEIIDGMLKEDAGNWDGESHWERNQGKNFLLEPESYILTEEQIDGSVLFTYHKSVFHFLNKNCVYEPDLQHEYDQFSMMIALDMTPREIDMMRLDAYHLIDYKLFKHVITQYDTHYGMFELDVMRLFGTYKELKDEANVQSIVNTFNYEGSLIDQIIQYLSFNISKTTFALIQVHGGVAVMNNYSYPRAFTIHDALDDCSGRVFCENCEEVWITDGKYWHPFFSEFGLHEYRMIMEHRNNERILLCPACEDGAIRAGW